MFETLLLQTQTDPVGLIVAITGLAVVVGGIIAKFYPKFQKIQDSIEQTDAWVLENEEKLKNTAQVVQNLSPEAKAQLEKYSVDINKLTADLKEARDTLRQYYDGSVPLVKSVAELEEE